MVILKQWCQIFPFLPIYINKHVLLHILAYAIDCNMLALSRMKLISLPFFLCCLILFIKYFGSFQANEYEPLWDLCFLAAFNALIGTTNSNIQSNLGINVYRISYDNSEHESKMSYLMDCWHFDKSTRSPVTPLTEIEHLLPNNRVCWDKQKKNTRQHLKFPSASKYSHENAHAIIWNETFLMITLQS